MPGEVADPKKVKCAGCDDEFEPDVLLHCRCLGCRGMFWRCPKCFQKFTSCSGACAEKHRQQLRDFFGVSSPKIPGPPDRGPEPGGLL
jgi:hypothetical protein